MVVHLANKCKRIMELRSTLAHPQKFSMSEVMYTTTFRKKLVFYGEELFALRRWRFKANLIQVLH
jgi:hypothetical protein